MAFLERKYLLAWIPRVSGTSALKAQSELQPPGSVTDGLVSLALTRQNLAEESQEVRDYMVKQQVPKLGQTQLSGFGGICLAPSLISLPVCV